VNVRWSHGSEQKYSAKAMRSLHTTASVSSSNSAAIAFWMRALVTGVCSDVFTMTRFPAASMSLTMTSAHSIGKLKGAMFPMTPFG
jgi:hypothetical protein